MSRIYIKSGDVPGWFRAKCLAACAPVGGSILRYWFDAGAFHAEINVPGTRPMVARSVNGAERLEIIGRDADGNEFVSRLETDPEGTEPDAGGSALGLLVPELTEGAKWHA